MKSPIIFLVYKVLNKNNLAKLHPIDPNLTSYVETELIFCFFALPVYLEHCWLGWVFFFSIPIGLWLIKSSIYDIIYRYSILYPKTLSKSLLTRPRNTALPKQSHSSSGNFSLTKTFTKHRLSTRHCIRTGKRRRNKTWLLTLRNSPPSKEGC